MQLHKVIDGRTFPVPGKAEEHDATLLDDGLCSVGDLPFDIFVEGLE